MYWFSSVEKVGFDIFKTELVSTVFPSFTQRLLLDIKSASILLPISSFMSLKRPLPQPFFSIVRFTSKSLDSMRLGRYAWSMDGKCI